MHAITCASSPAPPRSTLKHGSMGSVHVWEGSAARAARSERGRGLPNREGATSGGNTCATAALRSSSRLVTSPCPQHATHLRSTMRAQPTHAACGAARHAAAHAGPRQAAACTPLVARQRRRLSHRSRRNAAAARCDASAQPAQAAAAAATEAEAAFADLAAAHCSTCAVALQPWSDGSLHRGSGLFLTAAASQGDVVLRVPTSLCLAVDYAAGLRLPPGAWPRLQRGVQKDAALPWDILLVRWAGPARCTCCCLWAALESCSKHTIICVVAEHGVTCSVFGWKANAHPRHRPPPATGPRAPGLAVGRRRRLLGAVQQCGTAPAPGPHAPPLPPAAAAAAAAARRHRGGGRSAAGAAGGAVPGPGRQHVRRCARRIPAASGHLARETCDGVAPAGACACTATHITCICTPVCSHPLPPPPPASPCADGPTWLQWGFGCVRSRAFRLADEHFAFVPLLDVANHAADPSCDFRCGGGCGVRHSAVPYSDCMRPGPPSAGA